MTGRWDRFYPPSRPRPVEGGIKSRSRRGPIGETWWSQRFIDLLESFRLGGRLERGRTYARAGQVLDLELSPGRVRARVQGSRKVPYRVEIGVPVLSRRDWDRAEEAMAGQAIFVAKLLAGEMPRDIEGVFAASRLSLFPATRKELAMECSCPDWETPCKHLAATLYILAERFDQDPFLLFAWRGRTKDQLIADLRARRGSTEDIEHEVPVSPAGPSPELPLEGFWDVGPGLEEVVVSPVAPGAPEALLLDPPSELVELLAPAYQAMTAAARRRLTGDPDAVEGRQQEAPLRSSPASSPQPRSRP